MRNRSIAFTLILGLVIATLAIPTSSADAAKREKSLVRIVNPTSYSVYYTVVDAYGAESGWIDPNSYEDWTAAHDGTIRTYGKAYKNGKEVLVWDAATWNVKNTPKFRITLQ